MESFRGSCDRFLDYPKNLVRHDILSHNLQSYHRRLRDQGNRLFDDERRAAVGFLEFKDENQEYLEGPVHSLWELKQQLKKTLQPGRKDPRCRFVFIQAPHSRAPLQISAGMLSLLFTYHQVMPSFLDFVFPFGKQIYPQDIHFSGLREEFRFTSQQGETEIAELGRSGSELRLCYNLRSVERTDDHSDLPWSIRQSAVYQTFDIRTGQALWIFVKGNKLIKDRITEASKAAPWSTNTSLSEAFSATLATHLLLCDWSGENWRWYINDLENQLQVLTRRVLATQVERSPSPISSPVSSDSFFMSPRSRTSTFPPSSPSGGDKYPSPSRSATNQFSVRTQSAPLSPTLSSQAPTLTGNSHLPTTADDACNNHDRRETAGITKSSISSFRIVSLLQYMRNWGGKGLWPRWTKRDQQLYRSSDVEMHTAPVTSEGKLIPEELPPALFNKENAGPEETFTFRDLQRLHYIEEKAQEVLLVLKLNTEVLDELRQHYKHATDHSDFPHELKSGCKGDLSRFDRCVLGVKKDLGMLHSRTQNLLQLLANRKDLLNDILQYRSVKASESLAKKAQTSADHMELMTIEMHEIAKKTKQETVSMRVITSVTLFFLPATFIATFMSTDILKFAQGEEYFQIKGLRIYLAIALPLTALTFIAWYIIYRMAKKNEAQSAHQSQSTTTSQEV